MSSDALWVWYDGLLMLYDALWVWHDWVAVWTDLL